MPRSVRMRASTGKAVTDIATPMNSAKLVNGTSLDDEARIEAQRERAPSRNGTTMLGVRDADDRVAGARGARAGFELEPDQEHVEDRRRAAR